MVKQDLIVEMLFELYLNGNDSGGIGVKKINLLKLTYWKMLNFRRFLYKGWETLGGTWEF